MSDPLGQIEGRSDIEPGEFVLKFCGDPPVLVVNLQGEHQFETAFAPRQQDLVWWPGEQDARHEHVRVQDDLHRLLLTFRTTLATSDLLIRASRA